MADVNSLGDTAIDETEEAEELRELDLQKIKERRQSGETDKDILQDIITNAGSELSVNGLPIYLNSALEGGESETAILDFMMSANVIRDDIDSKGEAFVAGAATGLTNFIGLPMDLSNMASRGLETLGRKGLNLLFGTELSTNPEDYLFSNDNPIGGSQSIRDTGELVTNTALETVGSDTRIDYVDNKNELNPELRSSFGAGRIIGENVIPVAGIATAAKTGVASGNALINAVKENPKAFVKTEVGASTGQIALQAAAEESGLGDSPYVMAGAEMLGAIVGSNPIKSVTTGPRLAIAAAKKWGAPLARKLRTRFSDKGALDAAFASILNAADIKRKDLLSEAKAASEAGDTILAQNLTAQADAFQPSAMLQSITEGLARQESLVGGNANLPSGTLSDNPALLAVQRDMMGNSGEFSSEVMQRANAATTALLNMSEALARGGNPTAAATMRTRAFSEAINITLANARNNAEAALKSLDGSDAAAASNLAQKTLFQAKDNMRKMETFLWGRIDNTQTVDASGINATIETIKTNRLLDGMSIGGKGEVNDAIEALSARIANGEQIPVGDVLKFRRIILNQSRVAAGANDFFNAALFDSIANSTVEALSKLDGSAGNTVGMAREFSVQLNKRFTRYMPKDIISKNSTGETTIRSGDVLDKSFASGGKRASTNFFELQTAADDTDMFARGIDALRERDLDDAYDAWKADRATKLEQKPTVATQDAPVEIAGPATTEVSTIVGQRPTRLNENDVPPKPASETEIDDLLEFAADMDAQGKTEFADEARRRAVSLDGNLGSRGEKTFDPAAEPEVDAPEVDDFELNPGGPSSVANIDTPVQINLGEQMGAAQEEFLRAKVLELRNATPLQGGAEFIDSATLEKFVADNPELVKRFPTLENDIQVMFEAQRVSERLVDDLGKAANTSRLPEAIGDALSKDNPSEAFARLANEANGVEAIAEFKSATLDEIFKGAVFNNGDPDMLQIANRLFSPVNKTSGGPTILDLMLENGVMGADEVAAVGELVAEGVRIQKSAVDPIVFDRVLMQTPDIANNMARILGANVGVLFGTGNASLQAASIGSGYFKRQIDALPLGKERIQMMNLLKQPKLLARMLEGVPDTRLVAGQTAKEYLDQIKNLEIGALVTQVVKDVGESAIQSLPVSAVSAVSQNAGVEEDLPIVTQMSQALPEVDDADGNPR